MEKKFFFALLLLMNTTFLSAEENIKTPHSSEEYCELAKNLKNFQDLITELSDGSNQEEVKETRMSFRNPKAGFKNGGLCWWHSRFQRKAHYLAIYFPDRPRPTFEEAKDLIEDIIDGKKVVEIPGFNNLQEFSSEYKDYLIKRFERWQLQDTLTGAWLKGLKGEILSPERAAKKLKHTMDDLYVLVHEKNALAYQMLQIKGIVAHAWLVSKMTERKNQDGEKIGYTLYVIDSNTQLISSQYDYTYGQTNFNLKYGKENSFVPFTQNESELENIYTATVNYCHPDRLTKRLSLQRLTKEKWKDLME